MAAVVAALPACATPLTLPASDFGRGAAIDRVWVNRVPQQFGILGTDHSRMAGALGATQRVDDRLNEKWRGEAARPRPGG